VVFAPLYTSAMSLPPVFRTLKTSRISVGRLGHQSESRRSPNQTCRPERRAEAPSRGSPGTRPSRIKRAAVLSLVATLSSE
jgi:hypothetical protein